MYFCIIGRAPVRLVGSRSSGCQMGHMLSPVPLVFAHICEKLLEIGTPPGARAVPWAEMRPTDSFPRRYWCGATGVPICDTLRLIRGITKAAGARAPLAGVS
jgi:hypothetical protein